MLLVTGGAGYIGSQFVKKYVAANPSGTVVVVDNLSEGHEQSLPQTGIEVVRSNIGDVEAMKALIVRHNIQAAVHFAASCYVGESQKEPAKYFHNNVVNGLLLLEALDQCDVRRFVFSSSCATYGNPVQLPMDESHPQQPVNVYGMTKMMIEKSLQAYSQTRGWSCVALRYFNAAGAAEDGSLGESHDPETHIIPLALQTALGKRSVLEIYGDDYDTEDGTCIRDYVHISDLADAHISALDLTAEQESFEAVNLGTAKGASVKEVVELCRQVTGRDIPVEYAPRRDGDPPVLVADNKKAAQLLWLAAQA